MACLVLYWVYTMIKNILFDFDGVILDSMKIKGDGFLELFKEHDVKYLNSIETYHYENGGVSRFDKIRYFYENIIRKEISEEEIVSLSEKFGNIITKKLIDKNNLIEDSMKFIISKYEKYNLHIVSGAEHNELNMICKQLDIKNFFLTINGSPTKKSLLVSKVMAEFKYKQSETILIGDANTDLMAANENSIEFYGYNNKTLKKCNYIESFQKFYL